MPSGSAPGGMPGAMMSPHSMSGTVTQLDPNTGRLAVKTEAGDLFRRSSDGSQEEGDDVTVYLAFSKGKGMTICLAQAILAYSPQTTRGGDHAR